MIRWHIEIQDHFTWEWNRITPTLDGKPRIFRTRAAAEDYAREYGYAGGRNQFTRYAKEITP